MTENIQVQSGAEFEELRNRLALLAALVDKKVCVTPTAIVTEELDGDRGARAAALRQAAVKVAESTTIDDLDHASTPSGHIKYVVLEFISHYL